jgi:hypothetical protein
MLMTHTAAQGMGTDELRVQALEVMATLSEDQLLVVIAYARSLLGETFSRPIDHALESLIEERI